MTYQTMLYATDGPVATISLNRPERLNTIVPPMPEELASGVDEANLDQAIKVIVSRGVGRSFCAGFDFGPEFDEGYGERFYTDGAWDPGKDLIGANSHQLGYVSKFMSLWHSPKPVIAQVHGSRSCPETCPAAGIATCRNETGSQQDLRGSWYIQHTNVGSCARRLHEKHTGCPAIYETGPGERRWCRDPAT